MPEIPETLPLAAKKMLAFLDDHYRHNRTPLPVTEIAAGSNVSPSYSRTMLVALREAGVITFVGNAEQAGRKDLTKYTAMFAPVGVMPLPRVVRPLDDRDKKKLPENHSLGPRTAMTAEQYLSRVKKPPRYKGPIIAPRYVPPFEEMTPEKYDMWSHRALAMLAR